jgi:zinc D-Ala-D-Ala carboxypeptidase
LAQQRQRNNFVTDYKYFQPSEVVGLDQGLCVLLDQARGLAGVPFVITSGLRTEAQNEALTEAVKDSAHLTGNAVDLACSDDPSRFAMLKALLQVGFIRIGIYAAHIHVDNSTALPANVCWYVQGT